SDALEDEAGVISVRTGAMTGDDASWADCLLQPEFSRDCPRGLVGAEDCGGGLGALTGALDEQHGDIITPAARRVGVRADAAGPRPCRDSPWPRRAGRPSCRRRAPPRPGAGLRRAPRPPSGRFR